MSILKYKGDYSVLALAVAGYLAFVIRFAAIPRYILLATIALSLFYSIWGIIHHLRTRSFTTRIMLEYFLVSILAISLVSTLLV